MPKKKPKPLDQNNAILFGEDNKSSLNANKIAGILEENKDKNFVKRIRNHLDYPSMSLGKGQFATHKMSTGEEDGRYYAYPEVVQEKEGKALKQLGRDEAFKYARDKKERIEFPSGKDAEWFATHYKAILGEKK